MHENLAMNLLALDCIGLAGRRQRGLAGLKSARKHRLPAAFITKQLDRVNVHESRTAVALRHFVNASEKKASIRSSR